MTDTAYYFMSGAMLAILAVLVGILIAALFLLRDPKDYTAAKYKVKKPIRPMDDWDIRELLNAE